MAIKKIGKSKIFIIIALLSIVVLSIAIYVFSKYMNDKTITGEVVLEDFAVELVPMLNNTALTVEDDGTILLSATDYEDFILNLKYTGDGKSYIRVLVEESWISIDADGTETVVISPGAGDFDFGIEIKEGKSDSYLYVNKVVQRDKTISVIEDVDLSAFSSALTSSIYVRLSIKVEAVQYNRIIEKWGDDLADLVL